MVQLAMSDRDAQFGPMSAGETARSACPEMPMGCMDISPIRTEDAKDIDPVTRPKTRNKATNV